MAKFVTLHEIVLHHDGTKETREISVNPESVSEVRAYSLTQDESDKIPCTRISYTRGGGVYVEEDAETVTKQFSS